MTRSTKDGAISRRDLLKSATAFGAVVTPGLAGCSSDDSGGKSGPEGLPEYEYDGPLGPEDLYQHAVASGDPHPDGVVLWTRVTPMGTEPVDVWWEIGTDTAFEDRVQVGTFTTNADRDFTVKVVVEELDPGTTYYYRFKALGRTSPVGRTKTAPSGATANVRLAACSCSSLAHGYFHAYGAIAARHDLDAVVHLGDYIYEYPSGSYGNVREYEPTNEIVSLADYRMRYAQYRRDMDLQEAHRQHPFIVVWDDHEIANNSYETGAENHTEGAEGAYADRRAAAMQAHREWMPIREAADGRIFRKLSYGDLLDVLMLDTRHWAREEPAGDLVGPPVPADDMRELLGQDQFAWLEGELTGSKATWQILGQQVMVGALVLTDTLIANLDQWHGYPVARRQFIQLLRDVPGGNVVILTGDIHSSWAIDVVVDSLDTDEYDPMTGDGSAAVEFVTPAITSPGIPEMFLSFVDAAVPRNPHVKWFDLAQRGFMIIDVTPERVQSAWFHEKDVTVPADPGRAFVKAFSVASGARHVVEDDAAAPDGTMATPAP